MKRRLTCLLVSVMTIGLLAACGQQTSAPADSGSAPAQSDGGSGGSYKIGYSIPAQDQFQTSMEKAIQAKAEARASKSTFWMPPATSLLRSPTSRPGRPTAMTL